MAGGRGVDRATHAFAWEGEPMESVWDYPRPPRLERTAARVSVVHAGRGTVEDLDSGAEVALTTGTVLRLAAGTRTRWTVVEPIRKVYVVR